MTLKRVKLLPHVFEEDDGAFEDVLYNGYTFNTKLTNELLHRMCSFLEEGYPPSTACSYIGIAASTHFRWVKQGAQYIDAINEELTPPKLEWKVYAIYALEIKKAEAIYLGTKIENINGNFTPAWVRDITILERRDQKNWGRNYNIVEREETSNPDESFL